MSIMNVRSVRDVYMLLNIRNISVLNKYYCIINVKCLLQAFDKWFGTVMSYAFLCHCHCHLCIDETEINNLHGTTACYRNVYPFAINTRHTICLWTGIAFLYTDVVPLHSIVAQLWHEFRFKMSLRRVSVHYIRNTSNLKNR